MVKGCSGYRKQDGASSQTWKLKPQGPSNPTSGYWSPVVESRVARRSPPSHSLRHESHWPRYGTDLNAHTGEWAKETWHTHATEHTQPEQRKGPCTWGNVEEVTLRELIDTDGQTLQDSTYVRHQHRQLSETKERTGVARVLGEGTWGVAFQGE